MSTHHKVAAVSKTADGQVLNVHVGEGLAEAGARAAATMMALQAGQPVAPYFGIGFEDVGQLLGIFTGKRWELLAALREAGPMTVAQLARHLRRDYKNVHSDITQLAEWLAVERGTDGRVSVPWSEIVVDMKLPQQRAA